MKKSKLFYVTSMFAVTIILNDYEYFLTADLTVPLKYEKLTNFRDFVKNGFKIILILDSTGRVDRTVKILWDDFRRENISEEFNNTFISPKLISTVDIVSYITRNKSALLSVDENVERFQGIAEFMLLKVGLDDSTPKSSKFIHTF